MVSFNSIPSALRVPFVTAEFDNSRASQGPALLPFRGLIVGQKLTGVGAAEANSLHRVTSADQVATLAGRGSQLHRMALAWFEVNRSTEAWIGVLEDSSAGVAASGTVTIAGTATASGVLSFYAGGELVEVPVTSGSTAAAIAAALAAAIGQRASGTVTLTGAGAADSLTVGGVTFVGTAGAVVPGAATFSIDSGNPAAAASLASQINAHAVARLAVLATVASNVVTITARVAGVAGNALTLATNDAVALALSGATLAGATSAVSDLPATATVAGAVVTVRALNAGEVGNAIDLRVNYRDTEALPAGITTTVAAMTGGASNPTLTSLISALGDEVFNVLAHPFTDATSLTAIEAELSSRFGPLRMIDGSAITAASDTTANLGTLGDSRNSQHSTIVSTSRSPTWAPEVAAQVAAQVAYHGAIDPARPFQSLELPGVLAPSLPHRETLSARNQLLFDGVSTLRTGPGGVMLIDRLVTTYQRNAAGSPDTSYLSLETMLTLAYLRYSFRARMSSRYPRHKLAGDTVKVAAGQAVITPKIGKAEAVAWFEECAELGLVEGIDQFKTDLVVERNATDANRLDFLLPPDLINQLVVTAASIQFRI